MSKQSSLHSATTSGPGGMIASLDPHHHHHRRRSLNSGCSAGRGSSINSHASLDSYSSSISAMMPSSSTTVTPTTPTSDPDTTSVSQLIQLLMCGDEESLESQIEDHVQQLAKQEMSPHLIPILFDQVSFTLFFLKMTRLTNKIINSFIR